MWAMKMKSEIVKNQFKDMWKLTQIRGKNGYKIRQISTKRKQFAPEIGFADMTERVELLTRTFPFPNPFKLKNSVFVFYCWNNIYFQ